MATIDHLKNFIKVKCYNHKLSYYKIWDAKQKVIAKIFGDWEESYQRFRKLLLAYLDQETGIGTGITPYPGLSSVIQYCTMYFGFSLYALKDSNIVSQ